MHPTGVGFVVRHMCTRVFLSPGGEFSEDKGSFSSWLTTWLKGLSSNHCHILPKGNDGRMLLIQGASF